MDGYYLSACAACGTLLGTRGEAIDVRHCGRELRLCSEACRQTFDRDPASVLERVDAVMTADQAPYYPLSISLVSGRPLGAKPYAFVWGNRLVRLAEQAERGTFEADPDKYLRALNRAAISAQSATYGMPDKCPVQGDILASDEPIDIVIAGRMIRVCCRRCVNVVRSRPYQYIAMVDYANAEARRKDARDRE